MPLVGFLVLLGVAVALAAPRNLPSSLSLGVLTACVVACSAFATPSVALLLAGCAWLDYDGFVVSQAGELAWHHGTDVRRLAILGAAALTTLAVKTLVRSTRTGRASR